MTFIKMKNLCSTKVRIYDRRLVTSMHKELSKFNGKKEKEIRRYPVRKQKNAWGDISPKRM